jgi:hypothetical protein
MKLSAEALALLKHLSQTWPWPRPTFVEPDEVTLPVNFQLAGEVGALAMKESASLPYYLRTGAEIAWITVAPDSDALQAAIADLRAWVIPSFGWDDPRCPVVTAGNATGSELEMALKFLAPTGYFRWRTQLRHVHMVIDKLNRRRELLSSRPLHAIERIPSLMEMRQQFHTACAVGNRDVAEDAIQTIDRYQLDTAANTQFMRLVLGEAFEDAQAIISAEATDRLLSLRLPGRVRTIILRAYHVEYLKESEDSGHFQTAAHRYASELETTIGGQVDAARAEDGLVVARLRGYQALSREDSAIAAEVVNVIPNDPVAILLRPLSERRQESAQSLEQQFYQSRVRNDWRAVQSLGIQLLGQTDEHVPVLRKSLQFEPNIALHELLDEYCRVETGIDLSPALNNVQAALEDTRPIALPEVIPKSWLQWLTQLGDEKWDSAIRFVDDTYPPIQHISAAEIEQIAYALEELYTRDDLRPGTPLHRALQSGLASMINQFTSDALFPEARLGDIYEQLLLIWGHVRQRSLVLVDGQLLLSLADSVIRTKPAAVGVAVEQVRKWLEDNPVRAKLQFAFEALDLLLDITNDSDTASQLWYLSANIARQHRSALSATDRSLLRYLGDRLQIPSDILVEYLPPEQDTEDEDPLRQVSRHKIAILHSWAPDAAQRAAGLIRDRTGTQVTIIQAETKTSSLKAAGNNDILLFLHRRSAHQLFYGLSAEARDKIVYVPGATASSIILALEQWSRKHVLD